MSRLPAISARKLIKVLKKKNFVYSRTKGSHHIYVRISDEISISIPVHSGKDIGRGLLSAILKDAEISVDEFLKLL